MMHLDTPRHFRTAITSHWSAAIAAALLLTACQQPEPPEPIVMWDESANPVCDMRAQLAEYERSPFGPVMLGSDVGARAEAKTGAVNFTSADLVAKIKVEDAYAERTRGGTVRASLRVVNCTSFPMVVEARAHFVDGRGADVEAPSAWVPVSISQNAFQTITANSIGQGKVTGFYFEMRSAQ